MKFNSSKTKEMVFSFLKNFDVPPVHLDGSIISRVESAKLLGVTISSNLKWDCHVKEIYSKSNRLIYFLKMLKKAGVSQDDMKKYYVTVIRPTMEFACQVWHSSLTVKQRDLLESVQKRSLRIIHPDLSYNEALQASNLSSLYDRREMLCKRLFEDIMKDDHHKLLCLIPPKTSHHYNTRQQHQLDLMNCKTVRFQKTFLPYCVNKFR